MIGLNQKLLAFLLVFISLFFACTSSNESKVISQISLERWAVSGDKNEYSKDSILYLETQNFNEDGILESKIFYTPDKQLKSKEIRIFKDALGPIGSQYKDHLDTLLSYYTFSCNNEGMVTESKAFDASNNELLRIESFSYNEEGKLLKKVTKNSLAEAVRIDQYTLDKNGNEQQVQVMQPNGTEILTEIFQITKYDDAQNWVEKWGFVNDKPFSYLARKIEYH